MVPYGLKRSIKHGVSRVAGLFRTRRPRTVILCYHSVNPAESYLSVSPAAFRSQVQWLRQQGFAFLTVSQLAEELAAGAPERPRVVLTFDDGFADNLTIAAPILRDLGATGTVFVTTGLVIADPAVVEPMRRLTQYDQPFLTPAQVRELHEAGVEIGAHTHTHSNLALLDERKLGMELEHPKQWLQQVVGVEVASLAYPFGKRHLNYTPRVIEQVRAAGYRCAAAVAFRGAKPSDRRLIYELPRLFILPEDSMETFAQKILGDWDWLATWQTATPGWVRSILSPRDRYPYVIDAEPLTDVR